MRLPAAFRPLTAFVIAVALLAGCQTTGEAPGQAEAPAGPITRVAMPRTNAIAVSREDYGLFAVAATDGAIETAAIETPAPSAPELEPPELEPPKSERVTPEFKVPEIETPDFGIPEFKIPATENPEAAPQLAAVPVLAAPEPTPEPTPEAPHETPAELVPHIYMALQPGDAGAPVSVVFAIDIARDRTPSDDAAIRLTPEDGNCNPQQMRYYAFPAPDAARPVVSEAEQAQGLDALNLPEFLAVAVTERMLAQGLAGEQEETRALNICTRKLWERLVMAETDAALAAGQ